MSIIVLSRLTLTCTDRDSDGYNVFTIDPITGMIRTKAVLDHEERNVYRVSVKATDAGRPPRHGIRALRVEVLALADNRPTFTSSSLAFNVSIVDLVATAMQLSFTGRFIRIFRAIYEHRG